MQAVIGIARAMGATFVSMAPFLLLGLLVAGMLHVLLGRGFVERHLGDGGFGSVAKAAILGVPLPLCSCGVVPTALSLRRSGASEGATVSFLISTPQTGVDSIIATYGMLGPLFAVFRPLAAFVMGVVGGAVTTCVTRRGPGVVANTVNASQESGCMTCCDEDRRPHSVWGRGVAIVKYGFGVFLDDISLHLIVGIALSGVIAYLLPPNFFVHYVGNEFVAMLLVIVGGIPLYLCATASIPIALALMMKGLSPGAAFVFLAVGPATNAATVTLVASVMGRKVVAVYLGVISLLAMGAGWVLNALAARWDGLPDGAVVMQGHHAVCGGVVGKVLAGCFALVLALSVVRRVRSRLRTAC